MTVEDTLENGDKPGGDTAAPPSIGARVTRFLPFILLLGLLGPFLASTWYTLSLERQSLEDSFRHELNRLADVFADGMRDPVWNLIPDSGRPLIGSMLEDHRVLHVTVTSLAQGRFLEGGAEPAARARSEQILLQRDIVRDNAKIGEVSILVDASSMYRLMESQQQQIIAVAAANVVLSLAIVLFVFRMTSRLENEKFLKALNRTLEAEIAERKEKEARLRESEARIKGIMENSPSAILLKDLDGRYQLVNSRLCEWHGLGEDQIIGKTTHEIFPKPYSDASVAHDREVLEQDGPVTRELEDLWGDGSVHTVVCTKFPVRDSTGELTGIGTLNTDVTEQRRAEDTMRQTQKMQSIGQLTGGVAHDFNNLLAVIQGNAEMLDEDREDESENEKKSLRAIYRAVQRGKELTMRLLAFSRRQPLTPVPVDMQVLANGMTEMLRRTLGETIEIRMETVLGEWQALADPGQLENAILNLCINARDAMPGGGEIAIRTDTISVRDEAEATSLDVPVGDYVTISVRDAGSGMPADIAGKAVEPFFTTKDVGDGTGLGLSMVYGFVKQSAGGIVIESAVGEGTTVTLYLPRVPVAVTGKNKNKDKDEDKAGEFPAGSGQTILVVEDDEELRRVARSMLEGLGYRVIAAEDAHDGMVRIDAEDRIDLLLSDVVLPGGISGPDLAEAANALRPGLKVLFMSGYADRVTRDHPLPAGAKLINKPFEKHELARLVHSELTAEAAPTVP